MVNVMGDMPVIVVSDPQQAEQTLAQGQMHCPTCGGVLRPYGWARARTVRALGTARVRVRPRRARCASCRATQVLLPGELCARRADTTEVIATALAAHAEGDGARRIAAQLGRPVSTVRAWLSRARAAHVEWLYRRAVEHAVRVDQDLLVRPAARRTTLGSALNLLAGAALAYRRRLEVRARPWALIGVIVQGRLLSAPLRR